MHLETCDEGLEMTYGALRKGLRNNIKKVLEMAFGTIRNKGLNIINLEMSFEVLRNCAEGVIWSNKKRSGDCI